MGNILSFSGAIIGLSGMLFIIFSKFSTLAEVVPENFIKEKRLVFLKIKYLFFDFSKKIRKFSFYSFLYKILLKIKILSLKAEKATDFWVKKIRQKKEKEKK